MNTDQEKNEVNWFLEGRRIWDERQRSALVRESFWQLVAILALVACVILAGGVIWETRQSRIVPYVVEVDKLGRAVPVHEASRAEPASALVLRYMIARWITAVREVVSDPISEGKILKGVYAHIPPSAESFGFVTQFLESDRHIATLSRDHTITVRIQSVVPSSGTTWHVIWTESSWAGSGNIEWTKNFEAFVKISIRALRTSAGPDFYRNPLGIYVTKLNWGEISH